MPAKDLVNGWNYLNITQDVEYSADYVLSGSTILYCDDAIFYDEQPRTLKIMWHQRLRWAKGQNLVSREFFPKILKALFSKDHKNKASLFVSLTLLSFPCLFAAAVVLGYFVCLFSSPLAGISMSGAFLHWNYESNWFRNMFFFFDTGAFVLIASRGNIRRIRSSTYSSLSWFTPYLSGSSSSST